MSKSQAWHLAWKTTEVQGRPAHYGEGGDGPDFVFLHGWALRDRSYRRALNRLVRLGLHVVAPSLPGFGGTADLPADDFSIEGYARWVIDFCHAAGIEGPFYLAGHSFGGGVAIRTAHDNQDRIRLLVLVNSIGGSGWKESATLADRPLWDWGIHFPREIMRPSALRRVVPVVAEDVLRNLAANPLAFWRVAHLARKADLTAELEGLRVSGLPVVVLWGTSDTILPAASLDALATSLGAEAEVIEGSHGWLLADPDTFGEVMTNIVAFAEYARKREERELAESTKKRPRLRLRRSNG